MKEGRYPFTLFTRMPRIKLPLSESGEFVSSYPVKDSLVIMEHSDDQDEDSFLNMLDEVIYTVM